MGINKFIYILLILSIVVLFYKEDKKVIIVDNEKKPAISFYDSIAYDITISGVNQVVRSSEAYMYKTREELVDATIITKSDLKNRTNIVSGDYFLKIKDQLYIDGNVNLQLENGINIITEQLEYNIKSKIAKNSLYFQATQYNSSYEGKNLYLDVANRNIKSDDTKMKIEVGNE